MDISTFITTVCLMRQHQRDYFTKGRKKSDLLESKRLEKLVDEALAHGITVPADNTLAVVSSDGDQLKLFGE